MEALFIFFWFLFAAYSVIANDSIQTLGTFLSSNKNVKWYWLWLAASLVLTATLSYGWIHNGDISFGRLDEIPLPERIKWYHAAAPLVLLFLTQYGIPVSTTFLVLSVFSSTFILEKMLIKSAVGYTFAAIFAYLFWLLLSQFLNEKNPVKEENKKYWKVAQWFSTGFLWSQWLTHDVANIAVFLPRGEDFKTIHFVGSLVILVACLGCVFYDKNTKIQQIVLSKSGTRFIRSATIIDIVFACILLLFKEYNSIPMSTTWVFVGLLCGRELAVYRMFKPDKKLKMIFPILISDFFEGYDWLSNKHCYPIVNYLLWFIRSIVMGKDRLAPAGYYVEYIYPKGGVDPITPPEFGLVYIGQNGKCKYIHFLSGGSWSTLLWSCAPTKKGLSCSAQRKAKQGYVTVLEKYDTHQDLLSSRFGATIQNKYTGALVPA